MSAVNDAAVEAAARARCNVDHWIIHTGGVWSGQPCAGCLKDAARWSEILEPIMRAAIVEEVAQAIEAKVDGDADGFGDYGPGLTMAARIVRSLATASES